MEKLQNVVPNERTRFEHPSVETMRRITTMARYALPDDVEVQVPPNLSPVPDLIDCGVGDLGGVSPVTTDHINPDYEWPELRYLESIAADAGTDLVERLPVYEQYLNDGAVSDSRPTPPRSQTWVSNRIHRLIGDSNHLSRLVS